MMLAGCLHDGTGWKPVLPYATRIGISSNLYIMAVQGGGSTRSGSLFGDQFILDRIAHWQGTEGGVEVIAKVPMEVIVNQRYKPIPVASNSAAPGLKTRLTWSVPASDTKPYFHYEILVRCLASGGPHAHTISHF